MQSPSTEVSPADVRRWLIERVAHYLERAPESVDPDVDLVRYGFDSVQAVCVSADFADAFGVEVPAKVLLDSVTIAEIAGELHVLVGR
ncbi:acyl carrier protein [Streptomyces sp. NPDC004539]|uniref:acyl carrier protein n=1 Tax=Streptomyces sp. NPDC004539 TaxID=3154280 RepID=UPI0033A63DD9